MDNGEKRKTNKIVSGNFMKQKGNKIYNFWMANSLEEQNPQVGDIVCARVKKNKERNCQDFMYLPLEIKEIKEWKEGDYKPYGVAYAKWEYKNKEDDVNE